jgi:hypothetical protein
LAEVRGWCHATAQSAAAYASTDAVIPIASSLMASGIDSIVRSLDSCVPRGFATT